MTTRTRLEDGLRRLGLDPYPSWTNFVLVPVSGSRQLTGHLESCGLRVRETAKDGLPDHIRVSVGTDDDIDRFLAALAHWLTDAQEGWSRASLLAGPFLL